MTASLPFQFDEQDIVQLRVNMKHLLIKLSQVYASWKTNEPVSNVYCSPTSRTENGGCIDLITQETPKSINRKFPSKDIVGNKKDMAASNEDDKMPTLNAHFSPKQMELATQLVGLHCQPCQPAPKTQRHEDATTSVKTAKGAVVEAMKNQFYSVYGKTINEDVFSTQGSTSTSSSLVVTKEKYDNVVRALHMMQPRRRINS